MASLIFNNDCSYAAILELIGWLFYLNLKFDPITWIVR